MPRRKTTDTVQLKLRIREDLRRRLEHEAKRKKVSLNTEMAERLSKSLEYEDAQPIAERVAQSIKQHLLATYIKDYTKLIADLRQETAKTYIDGFSKLIADLRQETAKEWRSKRGTD
jgi:hypothetical protein